MREKAAAIYEWGSVVYNIAVKLPVTVMIILIVVLLIHGVFQTTIMIDPISVPKTLADNGYTPEVAGQRLRDAMLKSKESLLKSVGRANLQTEEIRTANQGPNLVVPTIGLSLEAIISSIRSVSGIVRRRNISGEIIVRDNLLWLRLRQDGKELYSSPVGTSGTPDELLDGAAPEIWDDTLPLMVALYYVDKNPEKTLEKADRIIARLPESNPDVASAYIIKGMALRAQGDSGPSYAKKPKYSDAMVAYERSIKLDPRNPSSRTNLGNVLSLLQREAEAIEEYRKVIALDPAFANARLNLGLLLAKQGKPGEAIAEFRAAIKLAPTNLVARAGLADALLELRQYEDAAAEYREIIKLNRKDADAHYNLGWVLEAQSGKSDEASDAYREAIRLNSNLSGAHNNLGAILNEQGKSMEAIAAFREAIRADPANATAQKNLDNALRGMPTAQSSPAAGENKPPQ